MGSIKVITFFNNKGGVGKTTTVYHVAWMLSEMGIKSIAIDLDPQSNLTSTFQVDGMMKIGIIIRLETKIKRRVRYLEERMFGRDRSPAGAGR